MARGLWNGTISFGLISIDVELHTAIADKDIHFHLVTPDGACRLRRRLVCPDTGREYDFSETARGFEVAPNEYVIVDPDELEALQPESGHELAIENFIDVAQVDPLYFDRPYYLLPSKRAEKPYALLVSAMEETKRAGIGSFIMRQRQYLALIRAAHGVLILETLHYPDEVRPPDGFDNAPKNKRLPQRELNLAEQLIDALTKDFDPSDYHDEYRAQLKEFLQKKAKGKKLRPMHIERTKPKAKVLDLMERLQRSIDQKQGASKKGRATRKKARNSRKRAANE